MTFADLTPQFRELVSKSSRPESKRRKTTKSTHEDAEREQQTMINKEYLREAYNILGHINTISRMLSTIRRAYLDIDASSTTFIRQPARTLELGSQDQSWSSIRHLTNEERDQIDLQAKVILSKCADRVKELELLDKKRSESASVDNNILRRLLPARLRHDSASALAANIAAHHASITYFLNKRLTNVSQAQRELQEERLRRQSERTKTLGSGAAYEAAIMGITEISQAVDGPPMPSSSSSTRSWLGDAASSIASTIGIPSPTVSSHSKFQAAAPQSLTDDFEDEDEYDDMELSASQIRQFETENANILRNVQETLASVQQAESRLMEISALQMELVAHLTKQSEITDQLYEDAIATTESVEKGNVQLKEAKRRAKDSRLYILVFLIGASLSLLFLHYY